MTVYAQVHVPVHSLPSPENPVWQVHSKLPSVLVHMASSSHPSVPSSHSSMSAIKVQSTFVQISSNEEMRATIQ